MTTDDADQLAKRREKHARRILLNSLQELQLARKLNRQAIILFASATLLFTLSLALSLWNIWK